MRKISFVGMMLVVALVAGACGGGAEKAAGVDVDVNDNGVTVTDDDGTTTTVGTSLPDGWPSTFPVPDGAVPTWAAATATDEGTSYSALFQSTLSWEELKAFYEERLAADGWSIELTSDDASGAVDGGALTFMNVRSEEWVATVLLGLQNSYSGEEGDITVSLIPSAAIDG